MHGECLVSEYETLGFCESFGRYVSLFFFFSSRRRHTRFDCDWSSDVCSSDLWNTNSLLTVADGYASDRAAQLLREELARTNQPEFVFQPGASTSAHFEHPEIGRASCRERV